ncbi:MAG: hypothetical protein ACO3I0_10615 [Limisphaerales bacterium]|jgi:hypothetical protein
MQKSNDLVTEALRDTKHPFRAVENRQGKPQKHRYERRKAREFLKQADWSESN